MENLRKAIVEAINKNPLPLDCKYYVVADVYHEIDKLYHDALKNIKEVGKIDNSETESKSDTERDTSQS